MVLILQLSQRCAVQDTSNLAGDVIYSNAGYQCLLLYYNKQKDIFPGFLPYSMLLIHTTLALQNNID